MLSLIHICNSQRGTPQSNEWDRILDKNNGYIKNWSGMSSWGQDTPSTEESSRAVRGYDSARGWYNSIAATSDSSVGFRPVLEVLNPDTLGSDGLKAVVLDLGGGKLGNWLLYTSNGGGAFVVLYILCLIVFGMPAMTMEFAMGRAAQASPVRMYHKLEKKGQKWHLHGYVAVSYTHLKLQGIGAGFVPRTLDIDIYDEVIPVTTQQAYDAVRLLAREDAVLAGISSGAALYAAEVLAKRPENRGKRIVIIIPDSGEKYLSEPVYE